jgi:parallel beta-helix repeat protein
MDKRYGILVICAAILVLCFVGTASAKTWYVDDDGGADFTRIQNAIDNASVGDTILVYSGVYYENVVVNKSVTLKGVNLPVVDAGKRSAITLTADGITLQGFNATNSGLTWPFTGRWAISIITGNIVSNNNNAGIYLFGSNNIITGNKVYNNNNGIRLSSSSSNNSITGNNVCNNSYGIRLSFSCNNSFINPIKIQSKTIQ